MPALIIRCPECPDIQQGTSVPMDKLRKMLESGEDITVMGSLCGHTWKLSEAEIRNLRKAMENGLL